MNSDLNINNFYEHFFFQMLTYINALVAGETMCLIFC